MFCYVVTLHWHRAYTGTTTYVIRADCPVQAVNLAIEEDNCHSVSYSRIEVARVDNILNG